MSLFIGIVFRRVRSAYESQLGRVLVRAASGGMVVRLLGALAALAVGVQLARWLGPSGYGVYSIAVSVVAIASIPVEFGTSQVAMSEVAINHARNEHGLVKGVAIWAARFCALGSLIIFLVFMLMREALTIEPALDAALFWGFLAVPLVALGNVRGAILKGLQHLVKGDVPELLLRPAFFSILLAIAFISGVSASPASAMMLSLLAALLAFILGGVMLFRSTPGSVRAASPSIQSRDWLKRTVPLGLNKSMMVIKGHLAVLILGLLSIASEVGQLKVATAIVLVVTMPSLMLHGVVSPIFARLYSTDDYVGINKLSAVVSLVGLLAIAPALLLLWLYGERLVAFAFGPDFVGAVPLVLLLLLGQVVPAALGPSTQILSMCRRGDRAMRALIASLVVSVTLALFCAKAYGAMGVAAAVVAGVIVQSAISWWYVRAEYGFDSSVFSLCRVFGLPQR